VKKTMKAALAAALVLGTTSVARADLTINGAVGLPLNPTAQLPEPNGARIQGNFYDLGEIGPFEFRHYGVYGAGRIGDTDLEISGGIERLDTDFDPEDETGFAIGGKYLFTRETDPIGVRIAAGAGYSRALLDNVHAYVVATKYLGNITGGGTGGRAPIAGHLGLRWDRFDPEGGDRSSQFSIYAGVEVPITRNGSFSFVGEIQSKNREDDTFAEDPEFPYSASIRFRPPGRPYSASIGVMRQGITADSGIFAQVGWTFDTGGL